MVRKAWFLMLVLFFVFVGNSFADEKMADEVNWFDSSLDMVDEFLPIDFEIGFTVANAYIWRGQNLGDDISFQPYVTISPSFEPIGDLSFTYWGDITKDSNDRNEREFDYAVDYTIGMDELGLVNENVMSRVFDFSLSTGYIYYDFPPDGGSKSQEVYWSIAYNLFLNPTVSLYHDWDRGRGLWYEAGVSHDFDLKMFVFSTYATLGYNHKQWGRTSALSTFDFGCSIPIDIGKHVVVEPFLSYTKRLKSTYTNDGSDLTHDQFYGGMNFSIAF